MESLEIILNNLDERTFNKIKELGLFIDQKLSLRVMNADFDPRIHAVKHNARDFFQLLPQVLSKIFPMEMVKSGRPFNEESWLFEFEQTKLKKIEKKELVYVIDDWAEVLDNLCLLLDPSKNYLTTLCYNFEHFFPRGSQATFIRIPAKDLLPSISA